MKAEVGAPSDNLYQKMTAALAGGKYPDVVYQFGPNVASLARSPKALDLTDAVRDAAWRWDDFYPPAREAVTVDGKIRAIPAVIDSLAVVYNKRLFRAAGIPEPSAGWTWDDYREIAQKTDRQRQGPVRHRLAGGRRRGHRLAAVADGLAARRRRDRRGQHEGRLLR